MKMEPLTVTGKSKLEETNSKELLSISSYAELISFDIISDICFVKQMISMWFFSQHFSKSYIHSSDFSFFELLRLDLYELTPR